MARRPNLTKWLQAWEHILAGKSLDTSGVSKQIALDLRRLIQAGWRWPAVYKRVVAGGVSLSDVVAEIDKSKSPPKVTKEDIEAAESGLVKAVRAKAEEPDVIPPAELARIVQAATPAILPAAQRKQVQLARQRDHRENEIRIADKLDDFATRLLDNASPYIIPKRKVSRREAPCPHCTKPVAVEEVHIHPAKIDYGGIAKLFKEASERKRVALGMPKQHLAVKVSDVQAEVAERLRDVDEAFKAAFQHGIESGLLSEQGAHEIWERARAQIEGKHV